MAQATTAVATAEDGVRIAYEDHPADDEVSPGRTSHPVVLVHGLGYARWGWEPVVERLADHGRVVAIDNRGIGASDVPEGPYTAAQMAGDVLAVLDDADIATADVIGISLGGMIAQELAARQPDRVERLVLVATTPGGQAAHPIPEATRRLIAAMPELEPEEALRRAITNALSETAVSARPELVERILAHRRSNPQDPAGWQAQAAAGTTFDIGDRVADVTAPTLIVHGTEDAVIDPRNAEVLASLLGDTRVAWLEGAGHLCFWEQPERFVAAVTDFLARVP